MKKYFLYFGIAILPFSCAKDVGKVNYGNFPAEIGLLFSQNCSVSGCHNAYSYQAAAGLNLSSWQSLFQGSNSGSPVIPYNSRFSSLCYFVNTYSELGLINQPTMPLNGNVLSQPEVQSIMDWVNQGAPDINGNVKWAGNPQQKKLYAVNQGCDVVTVFDSETQLPIRYIDVGNKVGIAETPHQVRVSPDGQYWYVVFINNNIMQKFRCSDDSYVGEIPLSPMAAGISADDALDWNTFVISKDSKRAYCVSWTANGKVAAVDLEKRKLLHYLPGFANSHGIALNAAEDKMYVLSQMGNYMFELDTAFSIKNEISLQNGVAPNPFPSLNPHDVILAANNTDLIITCQNSNEVRVFSIPGNSVTAVIQTGVYPQEIIYAKTVNQYFVSCTNDTISFPNSHGVVTRINASGYATQKIKCGYQPHGIACDEKKGILYVLSRNVTGSGQLPHHTSQCNGRNGFVNFINLNDYSVLSKKYELSVDPYFITVRP